MKRYSMVRRIIAVLLVFVVVIWSVKNYFLERGLNTMKKQPKILIYEMYPSSWPGGFPAMTNYLKRVAALNVDYVWLAPCYLSGGVDGGYDVVDYTSIDPNYGTMKDFDNFVQRANELGIGVVMDLVLNHTSNQCEWFKRSVKGEAPYDNYYLWSDEDLGWGTMFDGSSAFEWNEQRQQFYCHIFHKSEPDLNWDNPNVMAEFDKIIDFWTLKHGVAGFRVDCAQLISKKFTRTILPRNQFGTVAGMLKYFQRPKTSKILNELFSGRGLFTFGEMAVLTKGMFNDMVVPDGPLTAGLNLSVSNAYDSMYGFISVSPSLKRLENSLHSWTKHPCFIAMLESHDTPRFTSRAGIDGKEAMDILCHADAHIVCSDQGEELGLKNPDLGDDISTYKDIQTVMRYKTAIKRGEDPAIAMSKLKNVSRDNARVPIDLEEYDRQEIDNSSCLHYTQELIKKWK